MYGIGELGRRPRRRRSGVWLLAALAVASLLLAAASAQGASGPPVETGAPALSGTAREGNQLTLKNGSWTGATPLAYAYLWERDENGAWTVITGASGTKYTLQYADVGKKIRATVIVTNSAGEGRATTNESETVAPAPAKNTEAPAVSPSEPSEGQLLTASAGKWEGTPASKYIYEWEVCGKKCAVLATHEGAQESDSYRLGMGSFGSTVRVVVTDVNLAGSKSARSASTATVASSRPVDETLPAITGQAREGAQLAAETGSWYGTQPIEYSFEWLSCSSLTKECMPVGATGSTYTPGAAQTGESIEVRVTAKNGLGSTAATSAQTAPVESPPHNTGRPAISGEAREGATLTASEGSWSGSQPIAYSYTWEGCASEAPCRPIEGAGNGNRYVVGAGLVGSTIQVSVTASNSAGPPASATSAQTAVVQGNAPKNITAPTISGEALEGATLTASTGTWTGSSLKYAYAWERCDGGSCSSVGTGSSYSLSHADVGSALRVVVTASNAAGSEASPASSATATVQADGTAVAWGENYHGQLGQNFRDSDELSAVPVAGGLSGIAAIANGSNADYALLDSGQLIAWGGDDSGQNGDANGMAAWEQGKTHVTVDEFKNENVNEPVELKGVKQFAAADEHALAVMDDGTVKTWGSNGSGTLGVGVQGFEVATNFNSTAARTVAWPADSSPKEELKEISAVAAGGASDYALTDSGEVYAWGNDTVGQLGVKFGFKNKKGEEGEECHTETTNAETFEACGEYPRKVMWENPETKAEEPLNGVTAIAAGAWAGYAIRKDPKTGAVNLVSWGSNTNGELGNDEATEKVKDVRPKYVERLNSSTGVRELLNEVVHVDPGYNNAIAQLGDGEIVGWGEAEEWALTMKPPAASTFKSGGANVQNDCKKPLTETQENRRHAGDERKISEWQGELKAAEEKRNAAEAKLKAAEEKHEGAEVVKEEAALKREREAVRSFEKKIADAEQRLKEPAPYEYCLKFATPLPALEGLGSVEQVSEGTHYGLALANGKVLTWGSNGHGQQANGREPGEGENSETGAGTPEAETGYPLHEVHGFGAAVSVDAGDTYAVVALAAGDSPPPSPVSAVGTEAEFEHAERPAVKLEWQAKTLNEFETVTPTAINYKLSRRTGEEASAEEGNGEGEPVNVTPPKIESNGEPLEEAPVVNQKLKVSNGTWNGEKLTFNYQWLRCQGAGEGETCIPLVRWEAHITEKGETKRERLEITEEEKRELETQKPGWTWLLGPTTFPGHTVSAADVHHTLRAEVIASNSLAEGVAARSNATKQVYTTEQEREEQEVSEGGSGEGALQLTRINCEKQTPVKCEDPLTITHTVEKYKLEGQKKVLERAVALVAEPYEFHVISPGANGNTTTRTIIVVP